MLEQTRKFIQLRQTHCKQKLTIVDVACVGGGKANACSDNALDIAEADDDIRPVTGWIVYKSDNAENFDAIQHWWNKGADGKHFDTTPTTQDIVEYVVDYELYLYATSNYDAIESIVASSLQIRGERIIAVDEEHSEGRKRFFREIKQLDNASIFKFL